MDTNILANIQRVSELRKRVKSHCMCLHYEEDENHVLVYYPEGYRIGGVRVSKGMGLAKALEKALEYMEKEWTESLPGYKIPV